MKWKRVSRNKKRCDKIVQFMADGRESNAGPSSRKQKLFHTKLNVL